MPKVDTFVKETEPPASWSTALVSAFLLSGFAAFVACGPLQHAWSRWLGSGVLPGFKQTAVFLAVASLLIQAWRGGCMRWWHHPGFVQAWSLAAFAALAAVVMISQHTGTVDGRWHAWLEDDPMVSMQYARHLAGGQGLVWTPGERVEGFSNPLWTLVMTGILGAGVPRAWASALVLLLNVLLGLAAIPAVARLARALGASPLAAVLAAAGFGLSFEWVWSAASGMESTALACLCAWAYAGLAESGAASPSAPAPDLALWLASAVALLRFDGFIPAALIVALSWRLPRRRARWKDALIVFAPLALWQVFRVGYYHAWIPNTVILKLGSWPGRWRAGWYYLLRLDFQSRLALLAALSALGLRRLQPWALVFLAALGYALTTGGDFYPGTRYLAWGWPLLWALAAASFGAWLPRRTAVAATAAAALCSYQAFWAFPGLMRGAWSAGVQRIEIAEALSYVVAPSERVASDWAGSFYFFSDVAGVDLLGKCDPVVAAAVPDPTLGPTAHDKLDLAHSLEGLRPAWVLLIPPGQDPSQAWLNTSYDHRIWNDAGFTAHCKGRILKAGDHWALCHCRWPSAPLPL